MGDYEDVWKTARNVVIVGAILLVLLGIGIGALLT